MYVRTYRSGPCCLSQNGFVADTSARNFGLAIAYCIPGFVALVGIAQVCEPVRTWLLGGGPAGPTLSGVIYVGAGSLTLGMTVSALRWAVIDQCHHRTGVRPPRLDFEKLPGRLEAFYALVENHYRYYQFYANMAVATAFAVIAMYWGGKALPAWAAFGLLVVELVFLAGSRDALRKYYERSSLLLGKKGSGVFHDKRIPCRRLDGTVKESHKGGSSEQEAGDHVQTPAPKIANAENLAVHRTASTRRRPVG